MNVLNTVVMVATALFLSIWSCQRPNRVKHVDKNPTYSYSYRPALGTLRITSTKANPEINSITLFNDRMKDSLGASIPENGQFNLSIDQLPINEVYFLEISGTSTRTGTKNLKWKERVPIYLAAHNTELTLGYQDFNHPGSISNVKFSIDSAGDEQELLNKWQHALNELQADKEGTLVSYEFGVSGSKKLDDGKDTPTTNEAAITHRFIMKKEPLTTSLFLAYSSNEHRKRSTDYEALYNAVPEQSRQSKYGIDLAIRLERINNSIEKLNPATQILAVDRALKPIDWSSFHDYDYLLLSFWNSMDNAALNDVKQLETQVSELSQQKTALIHLSVDNRFSYWKKISGQLNLRHNYKLRNDEQQPLIDSLYLTELPRYVLIRPDGEVIDADLSLAALPELFNAVQIR